MLTFFEISGGLISLVPTCGTRETKDKSDAFIFGELG